MEFNDFLNCLNCGKRLDKKSEQAVSHCTECILKLDFKTRSLDHKQLDRNLQSILDFFISDVNAAFNKDPAAHTILEVLTSYPGIKAVLLYRIAHFFWKLNMPFVPRYISDIARELTAIDIHPGAEIGGDFFIDHGAGVVIGETAEIGNNVTLYSGAVLGGTSLKREKRHPTLGDNVVVGSGAKILGPVIVGDNVRVGANSVVINDVPPHCVVVGVPGKIVERLDEKIQKVDLRHGDLPDPISMAVTSLDRRIKELESRVLKDSEKKQEAIEFYYGEYGSGI